MFIYLIYYFILFYFIFFFNFFLLLLLLFFFTGNAAGQLTTAPTCPGDLFTFNCTVTGDTNGFTIWRVNGSNSTCPLVHRSTSSTLCRQEGAFTARPGTGFGMSNATSFSSTLSGIATTELDGILVQCFGPNNNVDPENKIGDSTLQILGQDVSYHFNLWDG